METSRHVQRRDESQRRWAREAKEAARSAKREAKTERRRERDAQGWVSGGDEVES